MVSTSGQLDLRYVPFSDLIDPVTLKTEVRFVDRASDFHRLATQLETLRRTVQDLTAAERAEPAA